MTYSRLFFNKINNSLPSIATAIGGSACLIACSFPAVSANIYIPPNADMHITRKQDGNWFSVDNKTSTVTIEPGVTLGRDGSDTSVRMTNGGNLVVKDDVTLGGLSEFDHGAVGNFGIHANKKVKTDWMIFSHDSVGHFDNITITGLGETEGLRLENNSIATMTKNTYIEGKGSDGARDAIDMVDESSLYADGSTLVGDRGISLNHASQATLKNTLIAARSAGLVVADHAKLNVIGGHISAQGKNSESRGGIEHIGMFVIADPSLDGTDLLSVKISDHAVLEGKGANSAGLVSQNVTREPSKISVSDSLISGDTYGIVFNQESVYAKSETGQTDITLSNSKVSSGSKETLRVDKNAKAAIDIDSGTQLKSGNGVILDTEAGSKTVVNVTNSSLTGNMLNNDGDTSLYLNKGSAWTGTSQKLTTMNIADGGQWNLTDSSSVEKNLSNSGKISLAHEAKTGTVLTVKGDYSGINGRLIFNTALGNDASATDKLIITGNSKGTSKVIVNNIGGKGAQTTKGIRLIEVKGASEGTFQKEGRIVAGAYDYDLVRGTGDESKNWLLTSSITSTRNNTSTSTPFVMENKVRPEAGSYIANQAVTSMFLTRLHDRQGETRFIDPLSGEANKTSLWLRQIGSHNAFRDGTRQLKTQSNTYVAQLGGNIAEWSTNGYDRLNIGLMAGYGNSHNNTNSEVTGYSSKGSVNGYSVGVYGTWHQDALDNSGFYADGQLQYAWFNNSVEGNKISTETYKSKGFITSVEGGYTLPLGASGNESYGTQYFLEPSMQASWMGVKADDVLETNGTQVSLLGDKNVQTRMGMRVYMKGHHKLANGSYQTFQPFAEVNWIHNTKRNGATMDGIRIEQAGAVNLGEVKLGVEGQLTKNTQLWGNVGYQQGDKGFNNSTAMLGVNYSF